MYGQRTADDRLAFGGRGAPYHFGSTRPTRHFDREPRVFAELRRVLAELFPALEPVPIAHRWGGPLGVARDWYASVGLDRRPGWPGPAATSATASATTNLAGRTLADLIPGRATRADRDCRGSATGPGAGNPEPLRWLGVNAGLRVMTAADDEEARTGRQSRRAALFPRVLGVG